MALLDRLKSLLPARRLNVSSRFVLLREAISGTMSKFYMARDLRSGQIVGLKTLDPEKTTFFEARFKGLAKPCEGEIAIRLKHPHIVETYEHGLTTRGEQYLVMEFLEGVGMNSLLVGRSEVLQDRRVEYIRQAAEALAAVHAAGFIHRDVCPRNLMLAGDLDHLKLIDFGLTVPATKSFMQPGNRTGTPNYMAPELVRRRPTDQRLDVFAFGVTAYEICTYELPWIRGQTGMAAMRHDLPPTDIRDYRPQINPTLAKAIHSCIEPLPARRCKSIEEFLDMIQDVQHVDVD
ncbi:MAG: protein kinase [Planctomycetes bacterium RBG_13_63_9]|nr:MAG: protein kinase [Planctomycetes bacterium RBG_13_63_9]